MHGRKQMAGRELSQSLKFKGMVNCQESKKLNNSVDKFKRDFEKKLRDLSVQQSALIASQRRRESRRGSLPLSSSIELNGEDDKKSVGDNILKRSSFSDSALDKCTKDLRSGLKSENKVASSPSPLKLPSIATHKDTGTRKIELEDVTSIKTPKEMLLDKLKYSRQANPRLDVHDLTTKLSNGYSTSVIASPTLGRAARRGSLQATNLSPLSVEEPALNRRVLIRRGSCPNLGSTRWAREKKLAGRDSNSGIVDEQKFSRHVEEMKKCRYLRFPTSIREDDEENIDSFFIEK